MSISPMMPRSAAIGRDITHESDRDLNADIAGD